jgi:UDP-N-acetylmuramate dehydrogenase
MNAGCHGTDWAAVVRRVTVVRGDGTTHHLERAEIPFRYRSSGLEGAIVLETEVRLLAESPDRLNEEVSDLFRWRQEGTPFNQPCCGSVFKNPSAPVEGHRTAGQLVDAAGLKGLTVGGARVSPMHANYIVNTGGASAADVHRAIDQVRSEVYRRFGVRLETEVKLIQPDGTTLPAA